MRHVASRVILWAALSASSLLATTHAAGADADEPDPFFTRWEHVGVKDGLPSDQVFAVVADEVGIWAGTEDGLALLHDGQIEVFDVSDGLPFPAVTSLAVSPATGDLWVGTMGGLARMSAGRIDVFTQLSSGLANDVVYGVAVDGDDVWVATAAGLSRYDIRFGVWEIFDTSNTLMHEPWCYGVTTADGDVYVAVWGGGVVIREKETKRFREHRDPDGEMEIDLFRDDGLVHDVTSAVSVSNGVMWVGTYFGLSRYDGRRWKTYNQEDSGLAGDFINTLRARRHVVWVGTDQGLSRFDSETWRTWRRSSETGYSLETTLPGGEKRVSLLAGGPASNTIYAIDVAGTDLWLGTARGLSHGVARQPSTAKGESR